MSSSLRESAQDLVAQAARAGMAEAWRLAELTPREIGLQMEAFAARRQREAEQMDLLAWLVGRYVMTAIHAPRRYPARPNGVARRPREMNPEDMKRAFKTMAERRGMNGGR